MRQTLLMLVTVGSLVMSQASLVSGQTYVRLQPVYATDTLSANGDSFTIAADSLGAFGVVKIQALDSYSGTWEVQCATDGTTFDTASELKLTATDATTTVYSVTDTVAIWDVTNAAGCRKIKVIATAGFAASDVTMYVSASQVAGGGGGGGGAGTSDTTEATQLSVLAAVDGLEANTAAGLTSANFAAAFGTAGTADSQVMSIQGIASGTAVTVSDGAGALNVICDSGCSGGTQYAEDAAHASGNTGTLALVVRNDAGTALAADGDNIPLQVNSAGALFTVATGTTVVGDGAGALNVICDSGCSGGTQYAEDAAHASGNTGTLALVVRNDAGTALAADGDNIPLMVNSAGALYVSGVVTATNLDVQSGGADLATQAGAALALTELQAINTSTTQSASTLASIESALASDATHGSAVVATGPGIQLEAKDIDGAALPNVVTEGQSVRAAATLSGAGIVTLVNEAGTVDVGAAVNASIGFEDVAETAGTGLFMSGTVRRDAAATSAGASGDNATLNTDALGRLWVSGSAVEDVAETADGTVNMVGTVRRDTAASSAGTTGDNATLNTDSLGRLWTSGAAVEDAGETAGGVVVMAGAVQRDVAASSAGTTGDNATFNVDALGLLWTRQLDPCSGKVKSYHVVNMSTATTVEIANAVASEFWYICSVNLVAAGAQTVAIGHDDTDGCGSITAGMHGGATAATGWSFAANGGITLGSGTSTVMKSATANHYLCIITGQAVQLSGTIAYVSAP